VTKADILFITERVNFCT